MPPSAGSTHDLEGPVYAPVFPGPQCLGPFAGLCQQHHDDAGHADGQQYADVEAVQPPVLVSVVIDDPDGRVRGGAGDQREEAAARAPRCLLSLSGSATTACVPARNGQSGISTIGPVNGNFGLRPTS